MIAAYLTVDEEERREEEKSGDKVLFRRAATRNTSVDITTEVPAMSLSKKPGLHWTNEQPESRGRATSG